MSNIIQLVKRAAIDAITNSKPTEFGVGTLASKNPYTIKISNTLTVPSDFIVCSYAFTQNSEVRVGDKVIYVRNQGGQTFYILDKAVI